MANTTMQARPNYGLDAPEIVQRLFIGGSIGLLVGGAGIRWLPQSWLTTIFRVSTITGSICLVDALYMIWSSKVGKLHIRDQLLDQLKLRGDETVLDLGCGHGLLLLGAAKRLPRGKAVGIDLWSQTDQKNNSQQATVANAAAEGVAERVEVHNGDMRQLPFDAETFDAVVSSIAIHNIYSVEGRRAAIQELVRVLKPGGKVALLDFRHTEEYARALRACSMEQVRVSRLNLSMFPPVRMVTAVKP